MIPSSLQKIWVKSSLSIKFSYLTLFSPTITEVFKEVNNITSIWKKKSIHRLQDSILQLSISISQCSFSQVLHSNIERKIMEDISQKPVIHSQVDIFSKCTMKIMNTSDIVDRFFFFKKLVEYAHYWVNWISFWKSLILRRSKLIDFATTSMVLWSITCFFLELLVIYQYFLLKICWKWCLSKVLRWEKSEIQEKKCY